MSLSPLRLRPVPVFAIPRLSSLAVALVVALAPAAARAASAASAEPVVPLPPVLVTAQVESASAFDLPASLDLVLLDGDASRPQASLSEALGGVPGLLARDRQNFAQDTQLSIRGFGARATFGVRGLRLYSDGIPATMPDGQGQVSHFAMAAAQRVEVMRGPFSALHGNSSGGVVQLWSADGQGPATVDLRATGARYGSTSASVRVTGGLGRDASEGDGSGGRDTGGYHLAAARFDTDGYRAHSAARRTWLNARLHHELAGGGRLELVGNHFDAPDAQDPLGLTWSQVRSDPRQATAVATQFDTRKSARQDQLGLRWRQPLGAATTLQLAGHGGTRTVTQYLPVPVAAQASALSAGGVIDLDNRYGGLDARATWQGELAGGALEVTAGLGGQRQRQHRTGYENFHRGGAGTAADTVLGVRGALRRDQRDVVDNVDRYAQAWWRMSPRWSLQLGARHSTVRFRSGDAYVTAANPDDSGRVAYTQTTPVAGLVFAPGQDLRLYLSAGRGFETPTFNELAYRADGGAGLALDLAPARSRNAELGAKWRAGTASLQAALFRADTDDELAVARNSGGRSSFRNVGRARRQGLELSAAVPLARAWSLDVAATWLDARFVDGFALCAGTCTTPGARVAAGTRIPGVPQRHGQVRLAWADGGWDAALEAVAVAGVGVDDTGSASAPGHGLLHLEAGRTLAGAASAGALPRRVFVRVDNVLDRDHVGSVIVNEANGRYYEPGPGRSVLLGLHWRY